MFSQQAFYFGAHPSADGFFLCPVNSDRLPDRLYQVVCNVAQYLIPPLWRIAHLLGHIDQLENNLSGLQRAVLIGQHGGNHQTAFSSYLLTGLVKCGDCGANFIMHKVRGYSPEKRYFYYRCGYHERRGRAICNNSVSMNRDRLEGAVLNLFQRELLTKEHVHILIEDVQEAWKTYQQEDNPQKELKHVERELKKTGRELTNLVKAIKAAGISAALKTELERCEQRKAALEQQQQELRQVQPKPLTLPSGRKIIEGLENLQHLLDGGTHQEQRRVLEESIEEIVVQPNGEALLKAKPAGILPLPVLPTSWCRGSDSNRHDRIGQWILSPSRLPIPPPRPK